MNISELDVNQTLAATSYARACNGKTHDPLECNQYARESLSWISNQNASCPFVPDLYIYGEKAGYAMDTERFDSRAALGINAPNSDSIQYRNVTTCTPLKAKNYARVYNDTNPEDGAFGDTLVDYEFGEVIGISNTAFLYNLHSFVSKNGYVLTCVTTLTLYHYTCFIPFPQTPMSGASYYIHKALSILDVSSECIESDLMAACLSMIRKRSTAQCVNANSLTSVTHLYRG